MTAYKYVELSYTIPARHVRPILVASRRAHNDQVMLFADEGGIVAAVTVEDDALDDPDALDTALTTAGRELVQHSNRTDIPAPWRMQLVDRDRLAEHFIRPNAPGPVPQPGKPVDDCDGDQPGCGRNEGDEGDDGLAGTSVR